MKIIHDEYLFIGRVLRSAQSHFHYTYTLQLDSEEDKHDPLTNKLFDSRSNNS